ncbi:MAG: hypothetical protein QF718_04405 [Phycisphaerales bacterium]|jgi:hypothetical protein|nr:hypothetical protein [Phycisphaerales bacterium]
MSLPIQFDRPGWLVLLVLLIPVIFLAWSGISRRGSNGRAIASTVTRCIIVILLSVAISRPVWNKSGRGVSLVTILDRSHSIPRQLQSEAVRVLGEWTSPERRSTDDRLAVISTGRDSVIGSMPDHLTVFEPPLNDPVAEATNLYKGVQLALAILPRDTSSRILLVSDGNETDGQVLAAADLAKASGVPIDVLPMKYEHDNEVMIEKIIAPSQLRKGQLVPVRIILRSIGKSTGTLHLLRNGDEIDLSPDVKDSGLPLSLESGVNAVVFDIPVNVGGPQKFEAMWVPNDSTDTISANNTGVYVSFVAQSGRVMLVTQDPSTSSHLCDILVSSGLQVEVISPQEIPRDSIGFSSIDAVILVDVPRWSLDDLQEQHLFTFVHDLGGGLIMTGGPTSFGSGGWIGSQLEQAMPIRCEPPQSRKLSRGALALIMHSCEMPEGNYWGQKMAAAAIESLSELDYIGIIEYDWNGGDGTVNNSGWTLPLQLAGDKVKALDAVNSLVFGDMQDFESPMQLAFDGLVDLDAAQRHVIIITDGDPIGPSQELLIDYQNAEVTVSTVMVGGHGSATDKQKMEGIAVVTGGRFYLVDDPNMLPNIFIKEAQLNSRSLIQEGDTWDVTMRQSVSGPIREIKSVPPINGYVVTGLKGGFAETPLVVYANDGEDPIFAWWHYGLGKSIAFTSDLGDRWSIQWPSWIGFPDFWEGCVRWSMRGAVPTNMMVTSRVEGERGIVDIEAIDEDEGFLNFLRSKAVVVDPNGEAKPISFKQSGPGRYHAEFDAVNTGAWLVNISFQDASGESTGRMSTAVTVPYPKEYSTTTHNSSLLQELASRTDGRVLSFDDLEFINLFDETDLEVPQSPQSIWDLLAILAASMLIIDVAIRRLWIDKKSVQSMLAPVERVTSGSVEALRRVHQPVNDDVQEQPVSVKKPKQETTKTEDPKDKKEGVENRDYILSKLVKKKREREDQGDDR